MRLCANENIPGDCVATLRQRGHDVLWIREAAPGARDADVLATAQSGARVLITFDKDFGDLVYRLGVAASRGVILFRLPRSTPEFIAERVCQIIESRTDWTGHFSTVDEISIRMRPLR